MERVDEFVASILLKGDRTSVESAIAFISSSHVKLLTESAFLVGVLLRSVSDIAC